MNANTPVDERIRGRIRHILWEFFVEPVVITKSVEEKIVENYIQSGASTDTDYAVYVGLNKLREMIESMIYDTRYQRNLADQEEKLQQEQRKC